MNDTSGARRAEPAAVKLGARSRALSLALTHAGNLVGLAVVGALAARAHRGHAQAAGRSGAAHVEPCRAHAAARRSAGRRRGSTRDDPGRSGGAGSGPRPGPGLQGGLRGHHGNRENPVTVGRRDAAALPAQRGVALRAARQRPRRRPRRRGAGRRARLPRAHRPREEGHHPPLQRLDRLQVREEEREGRRAGGPAPRAGAREGAAGDREAALHAEQRGRASSRPPTTSSCS